MPGDYSEELVDRVALYLADEFCDEAYYEDWARLPELNRDFYRAKARGILDLFAGRLIPPGSETREEWGARLTWVNGHIEDHGATDRAHAEHWVAFHREHIGDDWRVRQADLISRKVITTPWSPSVPDTKESA